jgi:hypothetical protein
MQAKKVSREAAEAARDNLWKVQQQAADELAKENEILEKAREAYRSAVASARAAEVLLDSLSYAPPWPPSMLLLSVFCHLVGIVTFFPRVTDWMNGGRSRLQKRRR